MNESTGRVGEVLGGGAWLALASLTASLIGAVFWFSAGVLVGSTGVGYATTAFSAAGFLAVFSNLGLPVAVMRETPLRGSRALSSALLVGGATSAAAALLGMHLFSGLFGGAMGEYSALIAILVLLMVEGQLSLTSLIALKAERLYFAVMLVAQLTKLIVGLGLALSGLGAWGLVAGIAAAIVIQLASSLTMALHRMGFKPPRIGDLRRIVGVGVSNYPLIISAGLVTNLSVLLTALSSGSPSSTGVFYISLMIIIALGFIPAGIANAALPRMVGWGDTSLIRDATRLSIGLLAPLAAGLAATPSQILGLLSPQYTVGGELLAALSLAVVPAASLQLAVSKMNAEESFTRLLASGLARLGLLLILIPTLAASMGLTGIGLAYTLATLAGLLATLEWQAIMAAGWGFSVQGLGFLGGLAAWRLLGSWIPSLVAAILVGYLASITLGLTRWGEITMITRRILGELKPKHSLGVNPHLRMHVHVDLPSLEEVSMGLAVGFMILLVAAAGMLALGYEASANQLAEYAYYMLVGAVTALLIDTARSGGSDEENGQEPG